MSTETEPIMFESVAPKGGATETEQRMTFESVAARGGATDDVGHKSGRDRTQATKVETVTEVRKASSVGIGSGLSDITATSLKSGLRTSQPMKAEMMMMMMGDVEQTSSSTAGESNFLTIFL